MGWSHSVYLAQALHEHVLNVLLPHSFAPADRISKTTDARLDRTRHGIYIDDCMLVGLDPVDVDRRLAEYEAVIGQLFEINNKKTVRASADGVDLTGVELHGRHKTFGVSPARLHVLCEATKYLLSRGQCTGDLMARLMGHWTWAVLPRRPVFSVASSMQSTALLR